MQILEKTSRQENADSRQKRAVKMAGTCQSDWLVRIGCSSYCCSHLV